MKSPLNVFTSNIPSSNDCNCGCSELKQWVAPKSDKFSIITNSQVVHNRCVIAVAYADLSTIQGRPLAKLCSCSSYIVAILDSEQGETTVSSLSSYSSSSRLSNPNLSKFCSPFFMVIVSKAGLYVFKQNSCIKTLLQIIINLNWLVFFK